MLNHRPYALGKFIFTGDEKLYIRGVTYGPFRPDLNGDKYHNPEVAEEYLDYRKVLPEMLEL